MAPGISGNEVGPTLLSMGGGKLVDHPQALRVVGIDLGTTNSTISELLLEPTANGLPDPSPIEVEQATKQGGYTSIQVPSMVALQNDEEYIGEGAKLLRPQSSRYGLQQNRDLFWDCKNDIGTRKTYHRANEGYRSAREISAKLLRFLFTAAEGAHPEPINSAVVTIPASFQSAQRKDTVEAANSAGLTMLEGGSLLDEPTAAFIAYMVSNRKPKDFNADKNLLVFDFGGGTCDVAIFRLLPAASGKPVDIAPLSVSRYCRLGGGDIDRAIITEVLLPQLVKQNKINAKDLDYEDKQARIIPSLLGVAEALKVGLCREITRRRGLQRKFAGLERTQPASYISKLRSGKELQLVKPKLKAADLDRVLKPFLDQDILYPQETEYATSCSIYAPIKDALDRSHLAPGDMDYCLLVGGGSLIPQVSDSIGEFFPKAEMLRFENAEEMLTAVSRGAALHALSLAMHGHGIFRTATADSISLRTSKGSQVLLEGGVGLPFPASGSMEIRDLTVPKSSPFQPVPLRVELCNSAGGTLFAEQWNIEPPVSKGDPLVLSYRMDLNQIFHLELSLAGDVDKTFRGTMENPLTHVVNTNARREEILELEEQMRTGNLSAAEKKTTVLRIAKLEEELGRNERALMLLKNLAGNSPDVGLLNKMAIICGRMKDFESEEEYYLQAAKKNRKSGTACFNLSLSKFRQGKTDAAIEYADQAIAAEDSPPYRVNKALLAQKRKDLDERDKQLSIALATFEPVQLLNDWQLLWRLRAAKLARDTDAERECEQEQKRRRQGAAAEPDGLLPEFASETRIVTK